MGIAGLLPALKSIQVTKHLSEFAGQTLAVDAYVWLHRGVYTCATELATGKDTHKYVDYAMHRVRLLRHHNIEPYLVFDGGPLPAKKGTEDDRKQRRDESLARGNALAAQGKHSQARECYVKCVDVTPQMAFQLIKALRAESVAYVVAPYEADAQMAYLERVGLVDGIITEDSDLLVFGCRNVLFKLDTVANTVVSISRKDFGAVSGPASEISLVGWSDVQFRAMAILSGCDYLPSIPGIGLKTACSLLRKWKTAEQVVRVIMLEGKKTVPRNYMEQFRLAELCFQHQRVYCPLQERLVHLNGVDGDWTAEAEAYVGDDLEPSLAKKLATGDVDPVTLLPMQDILPEFMPRAKPSPLVLKEINRRDKGKGKAAATPVKEGILSFFGPNPKIPPRERRRSVSPICVKKTTAGKGSGKRTLAEVMDQDIRIRNRKQKSKFFGTPAPMAQAAPCARTPNAAAGPSCERKNKENIHIVIDDDDDVEPGSTISIEAQGEVDLQMEMDLEDPSAYEAVEQEDGYISPTPSCVGEMQDLSSPVRPNRTAGFTPSAKDLEFGVEAVSSPPSATKRRRESDSILRPVLRTRSLDLPHSAPENAPPPGCFPGPDLRHSFGDDRSSDIDCSDEEERHQSHSNSPATPTPSPPSPLPHENQHIAIVDDLDDTEDLAANAHEMRKQAVITGWRQRWALGDRTKAQRASLPNLARRETNVTPTGRHSLPHPGSRLRPQPYPRAAPNSATKITGGGNAKPRRAECRRSLPFLDAATSSGSLNGVPGAVDVSTTAGSCADDDVDGNDLLSRWQLQHFRCP
ncbi:putative xeroderma pigmentosum G I-region [Lyophyllum shimeji]|uniref:Xeroderma pigmentosum G I-region n=1 Tax=Lyophyllum shimeji TaxID=47721 RepID=A0A9P3PVM7_LYOSH|nr:putative xeroderma pigmentosum G I-region [Lyophyllum shimeji]